MPSAITLTPRLIYIEDLALTTDPAGETASVTVLGAAGNPQTLNKIDMVRMSQFTIANNDAAAAIAGVAVGKVYITSAGVLQTRMS